MSGNRLFGVDIAGIIHRNLSTGLLPATLIKRTPGTRTPGALSGGTNPTSASYPCRGIIDVGAVGQVPLGLPQQTTFQVLLIGNSISGGSVVPAPGDQVTIEGGTYEVVAVDGDPANATYSLTVH